MRSVVSLSSLLNLQFMAFEGLQDKLKFSLVETVVVKSQIRVANLIKLKNFSTVSLGFLHVCLSTSTFQGADLKLMLQMDTRSQQICIISP